MFDGNYCVTVSHQVVCMTSLAGWNTAELLFEMSNLLLPGHLNATQFSHRKWWFGSLTLISFHAKVMTAPPRWVASKPGPCLNIKTGMETPMLKIRWSWDRLVSYNRVYETSARCLRWIYPSLAMSLAFWWHHNGPVTSQLTNPIKWPYYSLELIGIYVHINTHNKEFQT